MKEILYWFGNSTHRTKANYTLLLLQMCDSNLLLTAANVIRVLFMKEWNSISGESRGPQRPDTGLEGGIGADRQAWKGRGCPEGWYGTVNLILTSYHLPKEELLSGTSF